jgi:5-aminolevulinate synthase
MLLKCKYLAQLSLNELKSNSINSLKLQSKCPFLSVVKKALHTEINNAVNSKSDTSDYTSNEEKQFNYENYFNNKIESKKKDGSYRYFKKITRHAKPFPLVQETNEVEEKKQVTIWCSNDYLGLGRHPYVQSKVIEAVNDYGVGSGGTRNISGSTPLHYRLENE